MTPTQLNSTPAPSEGAKAVAHKIDRLFRYLDCVRDDAPRNAYNPYQYEGGYSFQDLRDIRDHIAKLEADRHTSAPALLEALKDKARLDFLEECRRKLNAHCGSSYGWEMVRSHLVNRLMFRTPEVSEMAGVDLNDAGHPGTDIRAAIDAALCAQSKDGTTN
jgi:hypothetical protein